METWLVFLTALVAIGIFAQWVAWRFRIPSILVLLAFGFIAGQYYDQKALLENEALFALVSLSVAIIMLEGGLTLRFKELKEAGTPLFRLTSLGAAITWVLGSVLIWLLGGFSVRVSILVGAILVVTGPTVIGPLLQSIRPRRRLQNILKWEGIVIDPIGAILSVLVYSALFGYDYDAASWTEVVANLGITLLIGFGMGWVAARGLVFMLQRHWIPDFLQSVVTLATALTLFTLSNFFQHESGLLTVTVLGICLTNQAQAKIRHIIEFKENLRIFLISCLFIVLGGRVAWPDLLAVWKETAILLLAFILVVRPAAVFLSLMGSEVSTKEKTFLALLAPRGIVAAAVSAIFALELGKHGGLWQAEADKIVPLVFGMIFGTVTFYGLLAAPLAKKLDLATPNPQGILFAGVSPWSVQAGVVLKEAGFRVVMIDSNYQASKTARMAGLETVTANVLSDFAVEDIDLSGIGRFLAVTPNDDVNSLACIGFAHALGRSNVYQLPPSAAEESDRKGVSGELSGRYLLAEPTNSSSLYHLAEGEFVIKSTRITEEFAMADFFQTHGESAVPLFIIRQNGNLDVMTSETPEAREGDTLLGLVPL